MYCYKTYLEKRIDVDEVDLIEIFLMIFDVFTLLCTSGVRGVSETAQRIFSTFYVSSGSPKNIYRNFSPRPVFDFWDLKNEIVSKKLIEPTSKRHQSLNKNCHFWPKKCIYDFHSRRIASKCNPKPTLKLIFGEEHFFGIKTTLERSSRWVAIQ